MEACIGKGHAEDAGMTRLLQLLIPIVLVSREAADGTAMTASSAANSSVRRGGFPA